MATEVRTLFGFGASMMCGLGGDGHGWAQQLEGQFHAWNPEVTKLPAIRAASYMLGVQANRASHVAARAPREMADRLVGREQGQVGIVLSVGHSDAVSRLDGRPAFPLDRFAATMRRLAGGLMEQGRLLYVGLSPCDPDVVKGYGGHQITYENGRLAEVEAIACEAVRYEGGDPVPLLGLLMEQGFHTGGMLSDDGLHPNQAGHQHIASLLMPHFEAMCEPVVG